MHFHIHKALLFVFLGVLMLVRFQHIFISHPLVCIGMSLKEGK